MKPDELAALRDQDGVLPAMGEAAGPEGFLACPASRHRLAAFRALTRRVGGQELERGFFVRLEPGFVTAGHALLGRPYYVRGESPTRTSPRIRPPVIVRCSCGEAVRVGWTPDLERQLVASKPAADLL